MSKDFEDFDDIDNLENKDEALDGAGEIDRSLAQDADDRSLAQDADDRSLVENADDRSLLQDDDESGDDKTGRKSGKRFGRKREKKVLTKKQKIIRILVAVGIVALLILYFNLGYARNDKRIKQLLALEGVTEVKEIWHVPFSYFSDKYMVTFEQPLDWSDSSSDTFSQRVVVGFRKNAKINVIETDGYCLGDVMMPGYISFEKPAELAKMYNGNYIHVEHRFFGKSRPEDMSNTDTKYWEYHTSENAANDYHRIYTSLKSVLGEKWASVGTSRGGLMTNVYGYYYPDDMMVYVPYVAPCSDGMDDERFYKNIYTTIGDISYGDGKAKKYRDMVTAFQVEAMRYKADNMPKYKKKVNGAMYSFVDYVEPETLYDLNVLEFAAQFWQTGKDFKKIEKILDMPDSNEKEHSKKAKEVYKLLLSVQNPQDWSNKFFAWPYYVNTAMEYGQYHYDFSYLREALKEAGLEDTLSVTEEMEEDFLRNMVFTEEQKKAFVYDGTFHDGLVASMETTNAKHLMIFGGRDPWYGVAIPAKENDNIKMYVNPDYPHSSCIKNMPRKTKKEIIGILDCWLGEKAK